MLALRAMRSGSARLPMAPRSSTLASALAKRGYATVAEEALEIDPYIYSKNVDMSNLEKGKGKFINYKKNAENIEIVRKR